MDESFGTAPGQLKGMYLQLLLETRRSASSSLYYAPVYIDILQVKIWEKGNGHWNAISTIKTPQAATAVAFAPGNGQRRFIQTHSLQTIPKADPHFQTARHWIGEW